MNIFINNSKGDLNFDRSKEPRIRSRVLPPVVLAILLLQGTFIYIFSQEQKGKITESKQITAQRVQELMQDELDTDNGKIKTVPEAIIPDLALINVDLVENTATIEQRDRFLFDRLKNQLQVLNVDLILTIDKHLLNRQEWEEKNQKLGRKLAWNDFPNFVVVEKTIRDISEPLAQAMLKSETNIDRNLTISHNGQTVQVIFLSLIDVDDRNLGSVVVLNDISQLVQASQQSIATVSAISMLLGAGSIVFLYVFLGKVDRNLPKTTTPDRLETVEPEQKTTTANTASQIQQEILKEKSENNREILDNKIQMPNIIEKPEVMAKIFQEAVNSLKSSEDEETQTEIYQDKVTIQFSETSDKPETRIEINAPMIVGYQGKRRTILVVDDEWINRSLIVDLLEPIGFKVIEASNGETGLAQVNIYSPDLIITDLMMPIMTGFQFIKHLRESYEFKNIPIIASSASQFGTELYKSIDAGATAFLSKPVDAEMLIKQLEEYLQLKWIYSNNDREDDWVMQE